MTKLTLSDVGNLQNETAAVNTINNNSNATEIAFENTLSRDGTAPNSMEADLDMNSHRILNLLDATTAQEPVTLSQLTSGTTADALATGIIYVIDGGGVAITTGIKGNLEIPFSCTIHRATLLADQSGSIVVNIWKTPYASYPPTVADKITASAPPTITASDKSQDTTLTGWTTTITSGDTLRFNVDSVSAITRVTLSLQVTKTA